MNASAVRIGYSLYRCRWGGFCRLVRWRFLLALSAGGWSVRVDQRRCRSEGERGRFRIPTDSG